MKNRLSALVIAIGLAVNADALATTTTVILEMDGDPGAVYKAREEGQGFDVTEAQLQAYRAQLEASQDAVLSSVMAEGIDIDIAAITIPGYTGMPAATVDYRYTMVLNGVAVDVPLDQVHRLHDVAGIKKVHRATMQRTQLDRSVNYVTANDMYGSVHELGPFDTLGEGFEGQGVNVAVIDTGIEWFHEMFGGDFTPPRLGVLPHQAAVPSNEKVIYYIPFADLAIEDAMGHGTHVASTAAGYRGYSWGPDQIPLTEDDIDLHGVAPQARLMSYGVCSDIISTAGSLTGTVGGCININTIMALEDAVSPRTLTGFAKPVADTINLSLGGAYGTATDATAVASSNAALAGAVVAAAAGNDGDVAGIVGSPSTGVHVISVAATNDDGVIPHSIEVLDISGNVMPGSPKIHAVKPEYANLASEYTGGVQGRYVFAGFADTPDQVPDTVAGNICLVERGSTAEAADNGTGLFANKAAQCEAKGAIGTVVFNNVPGEIGGVLAPSANVLMTISQENGQYLMNLGFAGDGLSNHSIRLNGKDADLFKGMVTGFSSRGPVAGYGQIKPDIGAPGAAIAAAVPPPSLMGALSATGHGLPYGNSDGTSMASPHVAGAAALIKQANPSWTPAMIRTALLNNATMMRDQYGNPAAYTDEKVHSLGGGLMHVERAANASVLMGVEGDGIVAPSILGSHSFGNVPVIDNMCVSNEGVEVVLRDTKGEGGTFDLRMENNRNADLPGVQLQVTPAQVTVPPNGERTVFVSLGFDSAQFAGETLAEFQFYLVADRNDGQQTMSMPFYYRAVPSQPNLGGSTGGTPTVTTETYHGMIGPGASDAAPLIGETIVDVPVQVASGTHRLVGLLEGDSVTNVAYPDLDMELLDPNGDVIGSSGNLGSVETIDVAISQAGTYTYRIENYAGADSSFTLTVDKHGVSGGSAGGSADPAALAGIAGDYTNQSGNEVDHDGNFTLDWTGTGHETAFHLQQKFNDFPFATIASLNASQTSYQINGAGDGNYEYRIISEYPGAVCSYTPEASNIETVTVRRCVPQTIAANDFDIQVTAQSYNSGITEIDLVLTNTSGADLPNPVKFRVVGIGSADVSVANADNNGSGQNAADPAEFDYSAQMGDETWSAGETSTARTLRFNNPRGRLFTLTVEVEVCQTTVL
ncbi:MAG: hypothetical protein DHS20C11_20040 [Lysobacteraceae bacterium]|nr:MAG: hypothetical protein DHS20C11_20040 [Xanthomonadaceae bacterium]